MIRLRGQSGYFSREVELDGTLFRIRELAGDELEAYGRRVTALQKMLGVDTIGAEEDLEQLQRAALLLPVDQQIEALRLRTEALDLVLQAGVVGWNIPDQECTPATVTLLPNWAKLRLSREILRDSTLSEEEQGFLSR